MKHLLVSFGINKCSYLQQIQRQQCTRIRNPNIRTRYWTICRHMSHLYMSIPIFSRFCYFQKYVTSTYQFLTCQIKTQTFARDFFPVKGGIATGSLELTVVATSLLAGCMPREARRPPCSLLGVHAPAMSDPRRSSQLLREPTGCEYPRQSRSSENLVQMVWWFVNDIHPTQVLFITFLFLQSLSSAFLRVCLT